MMSAADPGQQTTADQQGLLARSKVPAASVKKPVTAAPAGKGTDDESDELKGAQSDGDQSGEGVGRVSKEKEEQVGTGELNKENVGKSREDGEVSAGETPSQKKVGKQGNESKKQDGKQSKERKEQVGKQSKENKNQVDEGKKRKKVDGTSNQSNVQVEKGKSKNGKKISEPTQQKEEVNADKQGRGGQDPKCKEEEDANTGTITYKILRYGEEKKWSVAVVAVTRGSNKRRQVFQLQLHNDQALNEAEVKPIFEHLTNGGDEKS
jgi:hypothetical protein